MQNKNLKNYVYKLIHKVNLKEIKSESETEKYSNTELDNSEMEEETERTDSSESNIEKYSDT
jgi:hypothetical protein